MSKFTFTSVDPFIEAGAGEAFHFTYNGEEYFIEVWSTRNGCGEDIYVADGTPARPFETVGDEEEFEAALKVAKDAYEDAWNEHVMPALDLMQAAFLAKANQLPERPRTSCGCGHELVWVDGTHWEHDAAPYFWGDDHAPDAEPPPEDDPARVFWDHYDTNDFEEV